MAKRVLKGPMPFRCWRTLKSGKRCGKRVRLPLYTQNYDEKCPRCKTYTLILDKYRLAGRKKQNKDHPPRCDCHGGKSKKCDKVVYHDGVRIIRGPHRRGQRGCIHHPEYGIPEFDPSPPCDDEPPF